MKDKALQREQTRARVERYRNRQKGVTPGSVTKDSVTPWYPNKRTDDEGSPITPVVLSDGQLWYPKTREAIDNMTPLPDYIFSRIVADSSKLDQLANLKDRLQRAIRYREWALSQGRAYH